MPLVARLSPISRPWLVWILLLACGQAADLLTTRVDIARGAREGNAVVANLLVSGGFEAVVAVKLALVLAMILIVLIVRRYAEAHPGGRAQMATSVAWRGLQLSVLAVTITSLHNVAVLAQIQGWGAA